MAADETEALAAAVAGACAAWPGTRGDVAAFREQLAAMLRDSAPLSLASCHVSDLWLAHACEKGDVAALRAFEEAYLARLPLFLSKLSLDTPQLTEVGQALRAKLFLPDPSGARAKIATYSGRGPLEGWVRIVAVNTALKVLRRERRAAAGGDLDASLAAGAGAGRNDPETEYMKRRYRADFERALADAFARLEAKQRNVLRMAFLDGLTIDAIGVAHGVHRATAARWLSAARESLLAGTRKLLRERLGLSAADLESVVALVASRLEQSLHALLATGGA
jgi:RNA polymerase sigma-70 factor (ECF subfamily)